MPCWPADARGSDKQRLESSNQALDWLARKMRIASTTMFVKLVDQKTAAIVLSPMNIAGDRAWFIASHFDQAALY
ncbi:hypothetical protein BST65_09790 [Bradyrhizobium canariense]|nr:hypothetical protein BST65_09790 [Bradyrhizobium canariense]OSI33925.1 hypothetical protein BST66_11750 [Bradyrhizobium canariense]OSI45605.1 hypothetical protein BSZ20_12240 [Bradyrhizobium canariense]OSI53012.1 hypothetical protein BST67_09500 [Bradyrhizobium canariense]OSI56110.1 hypothetical protein BSZ15_17730 [Bradyrhizobium canariense]